jgi:hypothetical protein
MKTKNKVVQLHKPNCDNSQDVRLEAALLAAAVELENAFKGVITASAPHNGNPFPAHFEAFHQIQQWIGDTLSEEIDSSLIRQLINWARAYEGYLGVYQVIKIREELSED